MQTRIDYIKKITNVAWEARTSQLVSPIVSIEKANEMLLAIRLLEEETNLPAYKIFPSSSGAGYRVVCTLKDIQNLTLSDNPICSKIIVEFFNQLHPSKTEEFSIWAVMRRKISCASRSFAYSGAQFLIQPKKELVALKESFSYPAIAAGFGPELRAVFKYGLLQDDHTSLTYFYFNNSPFFSSVVYPLAEAYHCKIHAEHNKKVTKAALEATGLVDALNVVGLFLTRFDVAKLELTNRAGAQAGGYGPCLEKPKL